jgi:hypothetical protein
MTKFLQHLDYYLVALFNGLRSRTSPTGIVALGRAWILSGAEKLEARKMLENGDESLPSTARCAERSLSCAYVFICIQPSVTAGCIQWRVLQR